MSVFTDKSLLSKAKVVWKTLVVVILSVLLFAPTPALALDYNGTLQTYVSNTKVEIDGVLTSIKKLPNQSYENGKTTLAEIDSKLHKIQTDAGKNAKVFQNLSAQAQKEYEQVLNQINQQDTSTSLILPAYQETNLPSLTNGLNNPVSVKIFAEGKWNYGSQSPFSTLVNANGNPGSAGRYQANLRFSNVSPAALVTVKNNKVFASGMQHSFELLPSEIVFFINNDAVGNYGDNSGSQTITYYFSNNDKNYFFSKNGNNVTVQYSVKNLEGEKQRLANGIVLTNKISKLCDDLEKRINLAKEKTGNVKEYAIALNSFSDPDILSEITELNKFVADLTNNLPLAT